ncbi:phosphoribosyltransferase [Actinokineospora iranica]|uniref:Putative phosphoribosyl transferase n=1 Tax=Actinokineospora iranica TaxID=1271860 RepID=A0A1G6J017_9PSEU|nr:phosphoribosyltransferase family protein [Actinokineospora iranica]SDC12162.1 putative phosphoribosyl transferase [Actinokineospora iranica]
MRFADRPEAGQILAARLEHLRERDPVVLGLPRGGVPVAAAVADRLGADLDIVLVRKIGAPGSPELAIGAVGEGGVVVRAPEVLAMLELSWSQVKPSIERAKAELRRRADVLRGPAEPRDLTGRTVVVVDDGIATGSTVAAAVQVVRHLGAARVVLAVPVAPDAILGHLRAIADEFVCVHTPSDFGAVGRWYGDFTQVTDAEVRAILAS